MSRNFYLRRVWGGLILALALVATGVEANSGSSSAPAAEATSYFSAADTAAFSKKVEQALAQSGARVAILARKGRPAAEMPEGMQYTHVGFAVYSQITTADNRQVPGYAIYNLYQLDKQPDRSELVLDYPADFFAGVAELEAGIIVPSAELQRRLLRVIASPQYRALHDPRYSLIANPYTLGRQNCTEFVLDVIQAAIYQTADLQVIKTNTRAHFKAQPVKVNPFRLMLGSLFMAEISTSDQPGEPETATFERIADYLRSADPESRVITLNRP